MSGIEMSQALERYRLDDLSRYQNKRTRKLSKIHSMLRAK